MFQAALPNPRRHVNVSLHLISFSFYAYQVIIQTKESGQTFLQTLGKWNKNPKTTKT